MEPSGATAAVGEKECHVSPSSLGSDAEVANEVQGIIIRSIAMPIVRIAAFI
jgi:hypothetical protein